MSDRNPTNFQEAYRENRAPWNIGRAQGSVKCLAEEGLIEGDVLDVGCGTGDIAIFLADCGHRVWGLDLVPEAVAEARAKAEERDVEVAFLEGDALKLERLGRTFDTLIDAGLFHVFDDDDRPRYVESLSRVLAPGGQLHVLCFSEREPAGYGPRRVTRDELAAAFTDGWTIHRISEAIYETNIHEETVGGARAWLATIERLPDEAPLP